MARGRPLEIAAELIEAFERCARATEYLVERVPPELWRAEPAASGRTIAAIVAHMQSVRRGHAKLAAGHHVAPALDHNSATQAEAVEALRLSREVLTAQFREALARGEARVKGMPRRAVDMITYLMQHDAHHRGQLTRQARELGHRLEEDDVMRIWGWKKLP